MAELELSSYGDFLLGEWVVQPRLSRIARGDHVVRLEPRCIDLLVFLARHPEEVHSRERLIDEVWRVEAVAANTLTHAIAELRKALGDDARDPRYIETIHRRGYRLLIAPGPISDEDSSISRTLSHYLLLEHLGGGGMGVVYRAEDTKLRRDVALKFLPKELSRDSDARERFVREAQAASALDHPHICTIHEIDETPDGQLFIVMAFYDGETLKKKTARGPMPVDEAVRICGQVADGLQRAHEAGIVHRDIKPANVMVTGDGVAKIVDFGLAKLMLRKQDLETEAPTGTLETSPGTVIGTVAYMAPEQVRGESADHRSDIFALGVVLYEMLTGERAFKRDTTAEIMAAIIRDDPLPLADARPDLPAELSVVVAKALAKDIDRRYQSAGEFLADLRGLQDQLSEREGVRQAAPSAAPTRRRLYLAPVLVAGALFLGTVAVIWFLRSGIVKEPVETAPPRIVVLPFENLGPPEDEYFADGITEEIISRLSAVSGLQVISRTSAMRYKGSNKAIHEIGDELNVQYALEGTVRWERAGEGYGRVRITPQLIKVADDTHLWSDRYDRAIESVFEVQSDIAGQVVEQLHVSLLKPEEDVLNARLTDSPEAYEAYLRGLHHSVDYDNLDSVRLAVAMFERSVELDPDFAVAWANLSNQMSWLNFNWERTPERREAARHAAKTAIEIEPSLPEGHLAQGTYFYWCHRDYERALEALDRALAIRPNYTSALFYVAVIYRRQGHWQEAIELMQRAFLLDPKNAEIAEGLSRTYQVTRNFLQADRFIDLSISLAPDRATGYFAKSGNFLERGRPEEARQTLKSAPVRAPLQEWYFIEIDLADRRFEAALTRTLEFHADLYVELWGELGEAGHALDQCRCYHFLGDLQGVRTTCGLALDLLKKLVRQDPQIYPGYSAGYGEAYAYLGLKDEAIREAQRGVALLPVSRDALLGPLRVEHLALVYALVNEPDLAIDQLDYLLSIPGYLSVGALRNHPNWDPLRDHPRFQALLEKYGTN